jgi:hypothetical protein
MSAKIYCIECLITGEKYIGSTIKKYLSSRISQHKHEKDCCSKQIIERGNWKYYLLEEVEVSQKLIKEQYYMDTTDCINQMRALGRKCKKKYNKKYRDYRSSWGGDIRCNNNNLLLIDLSIFN